MATMHIGIVITLFLIVMTVLLIWDEIRAERVTRQWFKDQEHESRKVQK